MTVLFSGHEVPVTQAMPPWSAAYGAPKDPANLLAMAARNVVNNDKRIAHWHEVDDLADDEVLLDVCSADERSVSMIPGSVHIPLDELRGRCQRTSTSARSPNNPCLAQR